MSALEFIKSDIQKKTTTPFSYHIALYSLVFLFSIVYGLLTRHDYGESLRMSSFIAGVIGFGILIFALRKPRLWILAVVFILSIQTSLLNPTLDNTWEGTLPCFLKGCLTTIVVGLLLTGFAFRFSSWPLRRERLLLSLSAGLSGALMLEIHCDSAFMGHVLVGHVVQGLVSGLVIYGLMEILFAHLVKKSFPHIENIQKLG